MTDPQTIVLDEIRRLCAGSRPYPPQSDEGKAIQAAIDACAAQPHLVQLAEVANKALVMVASQLEARPLVAPFSHPPGSGSPKRKRPAAGGLAELVLCPV